MPSIVPTPGRSRLALVSAIGAAAILLAGCTAATPTEEPTETVAAESGVAGLAPVPELIALLPDEIRERGAITVPVAGAAPPTSFVDADGEIVGITPELVNALGVVFDLEVTLEAPAFAGVLPAIDAGQYEIGFPGATITQKREELYDMVSYLDLSYTIATKPDNTEIIESWSGELTDLCGLSLADVQGNLATPYIEDEVQPICADADLDPVEVVVFADGAAEDLAVQSGQVDARVMNTLSALYREQETPDQWVAGTVRYLPSPLGSVTVKDNGLAEVIAAGLNYLIEQGAYSEIFANWDASEAEIGEAVVNPPTDIVGG